MLQKHVDYLVYYQKTHSQERPEMFLNGFEGLVVSDAHSAYAKLKYEQEAVTFTACWSHARRRFAEAVKALPKARKDTARETIAYQALTRIAAIFHLDNKLSDLPPDQRKNKWQLTIEPLVAAYFL